MVSIPNVSLLPEDFLKGFTFLWIASDAAKGEFKKSSKKEKRIPRIMLVPTTVGRHRGGEHRVMGILTPREVLVVMVEVSPPLP